MQSPLFIFQTFCILLACRDAFSHRLLANHVDPVWLLLIYCLTATIFSWFAKWYRTGSANVIEPYLKLSRQQKLLFIKLGFATWVVYAATIFGIKLLGAAVFNVIDWGITPMITLVLGFMFIGETIRKQQIFGTLIAFIGLGLFYAHSFGQDHSQMIWWRLGLFLAFASTFFTALSALYQKQQVDAGLAPEDVLLYRFPIPTLLMFVWYLVERPPAAAEELVSILPIAFFGFFGPLWLLCFGLTKSTLSRFSTYLFLVPIYTFILGPIVVRGELEKLTQLNIVLGTLFVFVGYLVSEGSWIRLFTKKT